MKKAEKQIIIDELIEMLSNTPHFYLTDASGLNAEETASLRRQCFEKGIKLRVVKNTLLDIALQKASDKHEELEKVLKGQTAIMISETGNAPAKVIEAFRKNSDKPILKAAYVEESLYFGDDQIKVLSTLKSKDELLADIIMLLQSPIKNVISSLESGKNILAGLVKTISENKQ